MGGGSLRPIRSNMKYSGVMTSRPQIPATRKTIFANFMASILTPACPVAKTDAFAGDRRLYFADFPFREPLPMSLCRRFSVASLMCALSVAIFTGRLAAETAANGPQFLVSFAKERSARPLDGRILLLLSTDGSAEPRMQISISYKTQMLFGSDVDQLEPGQAVTIDDAAFGYPVRYLRDVPPGEYFVQAVLNRYSTFHRSDGHTIKLHMDQGEGQHWNISPGNLYSKPQKVTLGGNAQPIAILLDQEIPPIEPPKDTKYIRHIKIESQLLSKFWGRPMYLSANVLVPDGFDEHPQARFPLAIFEDHFNHDFEGFRSEPPDP